MSSQEYIKQAIEGNYKAVPIKLDFEGGASVPSTVVSALRKMYSMFRISLGDQIHTGTKTLEYKTNDFVYSVTLSRYQWIESIRISAVKKVFEEEEECELFLETGRLYNLNWTASSINKLPAQIDFSDNLDADYMGYIKLIGSTITFDIPTTPVSTTCGEDDDPVTYDPWGASGSTLIPGESRVVTCPICSRTETV